MQLAGGAILQAHFLARAQKCAVEGHLGVNHNRVIIHQETFAHRAFIFITVDDILEISAGVRSRGGCQADLNPIKMLKYFAPFAFFRGRVAAVAFIGDDDIKGMDGNVQPAGIQLFFSIFSPTGMVRRAKQVDAHALDGADVHKSL